MPSEKIKHHCPTQNVTPKNKYILIDIAQKKLFSKEKKMAPKTQARGQEELSKGGERKRRKKATTFCPLIPLLLLIVVVVVHLELGFSLILNINT